MLGAIYGDIAGSYFEYYNYRAKNFEMFRRPLCKPTDDTVVTLAVAKAFLDCPDYTDEHALHETLIDSMHSLCWEYPRAGYGGRFVKWVKAKSREPLNTFGNGSAMRVSPVVEVAKSLEEAENLARITAEVTHNHPEGVKGAVSVAGAAYLAKTGADMQTIKDYVAKFYTIDFTLDEIRETNVFDMTCQKTVPQAFEAFFESEGFEDTARCAISIGGDSDTIAAIACTVAAYYYGVAPEEFAMASQFLDERQKGIIASFAERFGNTELYKKR